MSSIARKLNITVGSLTTAMNSLVNKRYVERHRSEEDRRVVLVKLTEKGVKAYHHHEDYHRQMTQAILDKLDDTEPVSYTHLIIVRDRLLSPARRRLWKKQPEN